jgi:trigger factor
MHSELLERVENRAKVRVTLDAKEVGRFFAGVIDHYNQSLKMPGFRKGKIPRNIIMNRVGAEEVAREAADELKEAAINQSLADLSLEARSNNVQFVDEKPPVDGEAYELVYEIPLLPELTLPDYKGFRIPIKRLVINDEMARRYRERLLARFTEYTTKAGPAEMGDAIVYSLKTTFDDGEKEAPLKHEDVLYILGEEDNLPGYDDHLVGAEAGGKLTFEYALPNDFPRGDIAGKTLIFEAEVKEVRTVKRPELTPSFVKENFKMDTVEEFQQYVHDALEYQATEEEKQYKQETALSHLLGRMAVIISEDMIKEETDYLVSSHERNLRSRGHSLAEMLKERDMSLEEYRNGLREDATRRLKEFLAVRAIARAENIQVSNEELSRYSATMMREYNVNAKDMKKLLRNREFLNDAMMEILRAKVFRHIAESAHFYYEDEESEPKPEEEGEAKKAPETGGGG